MIAAASAPRTVRPSAAEAAPAFQLPASAAQPRAGQARTFERQTASHDAAPSVAEGRLQPMLPAAARKPMPAQAAVDPVSTLSSLHTDYGGLFYVLNVALAWRLYGDFTLPRQPGIALSPWDLLAWTGRAWFGEHFERDPLWPLLAQLAGRDPSKPPADDLADVPDWAAAADALAPWGRVLELQVHATSRRLRILHPQGFCIFDGAREAGQRPLAQARAWCQSRSVLRDASLRRIRRCELLRRPAARWLKHWQTALALRLRAALGAHHDLPSLLCRHRAEVAVSAAAVDVRLSLAELPLAVRFAGLDRDPGWIPAAGRSLLFHFE
jgi:hypothetical protein